MMMNETRQAQILWHGIEIERDGKCVHAFYINTPIGHRFPPEVNRLCRFCGAQMNDDGTWSAEVTMKIGDRVERVFDANFEAWKRD